MDGDGRRLDTAASDGTTLGTAPAIGEKTRRLGPVMVSLAFGTTQYGVTGELACHLRDREAPVVQVTDRIRFAYEPWDAAAFAGRGILVTDASVEALRPCFADIAPFGTANRGAYGVFAFFRVDGARPGLLGGKC